jgi:hypothetical protein
MSVTDLITQSNVFVYARKPENVSTSFAKSMDEKIEKGQFLNSVRVYRKGNRHDTAIDKSFNRLVVIRRILHDMFHSGYNPFVPFLSGAFYKCAPKSDTSYIITENAPSTHAFTHLKQLLKDKFNASSIMSLVCQVLVCLDRLTYLGCVHHQANLSNVHTRAVETMQGDNSFRDIEWTAYDTWRFAVTDGSILHVPNIGIIAKLENWAYAEISFPQTQAKTPTSGTPTAVSTTLLTGEYTEPIAWIKAKYRDVMHVNSFDVDTFIYHMHSAYKEVCPELRSVVDFLTFHGAEWSKEHPITLSQQRPCDVLKFIHERTQCMKQESNVKDNLPSTHTKDIAQSSSGSMKQSRTLRSNTSILHSFSALLSKIDDVARFQHPEQARSSDKSTHNAMMTAQLDESVAAKYAKIEAMLRNRTVPVWTMLIPTTG